MNIPQESLARTEELENQQSVEEASYETKRDDAILTNNFLLSVLESSFFQHDVSIQQENALDRLEEYILDTANKLRELKHSRALCSKQEKSISRRVGTKRIVKKHRLSEILCIGPHLQRSDYSVRN
jgi:hypothetical protein